MRVICIDDSPCPNPIFRGHIPTYGEIFTVEEESSEYNGTPEYKFVETGDFWYPARKFAPLSDIDEIERIDEVLEEIFQPVNK